LAPTPEKPSPIGKIKMSNQSLPPEILETWRPKPSQGPAVRKLCEEFSKLSPETQAAELGAWLLSRLGAILQDAKEAEKTEAARPAEA
jgi:hypothetical protein